MTEMHQDGTLAERKRIGKKFTLLENERRTLKWSKKLLHFFLFFSVCRHKLIAPESVHATTEDQVSKEKNKWGSTITVKFVKNFP